MYRLLVLCLCYGFLDHAASTEDITAALYEHCGDLKPQESIQIKLVCIKLLTLNNHYLIINYCIDMTQC
jgi:hypothetical protein